jgi:hypothetical protein
MLVPTLSTTISVFALLTTTANALPPRPGKQSATYTPASDLSKLATLMPTSALPAPAGQLKYVVLGLGTQNYTCTSGSPDAAPGTTGALGKILKFLENTDANCCQAMLYDIGSKLNDDPLAKWKIPSLSGLALSLSTQPQALELNLKSQGYENRVGTHLFASVNGANTPTFAFDQLVQPYPMAQVGKLNETAAPTSACPGLTNEGAVKWLLLGDTKGLSHGGIDTVYRLETAGGAAPATCKGQPASFEVKYAAQCKYSLQL